MIRLKDAIHVFEPTPGTLNSRAMVDGQYEVTFNRTKFTSQPYRSMERFIGEERVMQFVIEPGLLPLATAMSKDMMGRKVLVSRKLADKESDRGAIAHVQGFGVRVAMYFDEAAGDTIVSWECLYGVL
jgi:hypothetical protein